MRIYIQILLLVYATLCKFNVEIILIEMGSWSAPQFVIKAVSMETVSDLKCAFVTLALSAKTAPQNVTAMDIVTVKVY